MPEPKTTDFPPQAALDWFKAKGIQPGFDYRDVWLEEQANAFTVAKMLNADLLVEVRALVEQALAEGQTYQQFAAAIKPLLVKSGWWGIQEMDDPATGETKRVQLGSEGRIKTIYRTNMRTARAKQVGQQFQREAEHGHGARIRLRPCVAPLFRLRLPARCEHEPQRDRGCGVWVRLRERNERREHL